MSFFTQPEPQHPYNMNESVFLRLEGLLKERGVDFGVLRHQPVFPVKSNHSCKNEAGGTFGQPCNLTFPFEVKKSGIHRASLLTER